MWAAGRSDAYRICEFKPDGNPVRTGLLHIWAGSKRPQVVGPPMWSAVCAGVRLGKMERPTVSQYRELRCEYVKSSGAKPHTKG